MGEEGFERDGVRHPGKSFCRLRAIRCDAPVSYSRRATLLFKQPPRRARDSAAIFARQEKCSPGTRNQGRHSLPVSSRSRLTATTSRSI